MTLISDLDVGVSEWATHDDCRYCHGGRSGVTQDHLSRFGSVCVCESPDSTLRLSGGMRFYDSHDSHDSFPAVCDFL